MKLLPRRQYRWNKLLCVSVSQWGWGKWQIYYKYFRGLYKPTRGCLCGPFSMTSPNWFNLPHSHYFSITNNCRWGQFSKIIHKIFSRENLTPQQNYGVWVYHHKKSTICQMETIFVTSCLLSWTKCSPRGAKYFLKELTTNEMGGKNEKKRTASPENVSIYHKGIL